MLFRSLAKLPQSETFPLIKKFPQHEESTAQPIEDYYIRQKPVDVVDHRTAEEELTDNSFYQMKKKRSAESWPASFFTETSETAPKSYHEVRKVLRKGKLAFFKINETNSPMSELETAICQFYRLFAPDLIPKMHTVYSDKPNGGYEQDVIGTASKALPGFKSIRDDALTPNDLVIESLTQKIVTVAELKQIYRIHKATNAQPLSNMPDDELLSFHLPNKTVVLKASDLKHFEIIKSVATILVLSYLFEEDDLHCGNVSKYGRIDFDMSLWTLLHHFKNNGILKVISRMVRSPNADQFEITEKDILNFPKLTDAIPFYWPIFSEEGKVKNRTRWLASKTADAFSFAGLPVTSNNYSEQVSSTYAHLITNEVFEDIKYETFLRFCLMPDAAYHAIAEAEINSQVRQYNYNTSIVDDITTHLRERTEQCKKTLCKMPTFRNYVDKNGNMVLSDFKDDLADRNNKLDARLAKRNAMDPAFERMYPEFIKQKVDLQQLDERFASIKKTCQTIISNGSRSKGRIQNKTPIF